MISPIPNNNVGPSLEVLPEVDQNNSVNNTQQINVVSFGPIYQDLLQSEHFEREYLYLILQSIPPLIRYQPPIPSRVGVIPSSIKRSPIIPATHETTTLTHILEPTTKSDNNNISVFSGPHFLPEKYSIKPVAAFRQSYFVPNYKDDTPSRYYATPHIQQYFQAALQDGSYFEAYSDYRVDDPVNFRHAYNSTPPNDNEQAKNNSHSEPTKLGMNPDLNRYIQLNQSVNRSIQRPSQRHPHYKPLIISRRPHSTRPEQYNRLELSPTSSQPTPNRFDPTYHRSIPRPELSSVPNRYDHLSNRPESSYHAEPPYSTHNRSEAYHPETHYPNRPESSQHRSEPYPTSNYNKSSPYDPVRSESSHEPPRYDRSESSHEPPRYDHSESSHEPSPETFRSKATQYKQASKEIRPDEIPLKRASKNPPRTDEYILDSPPLEDQPQPDCVDESSFPTRKWHKPLSISSETTSEEESDSSMTMGRIKGKGKAREPMESDESTSKRKASKYSPTPDLKKRKVFTKVPSKAEAIEELRQLGKFIKAWTQKDAEVCCVCFEDVTTEENPLVYCDNALCDVIVHKDCYKIKNNIESMDHWYCDRCKPVKGESFYRNTTCVLCPNITGAFCKLSNPLNGVEWVHMICANNFTGPGGFVYQPKTNDYRMLIRHHIPVQKFLGACMYCENTMFAEFGAKLKCRYCPKVFHVTCASKNGYWCFNKDAVLACADHAITTTNKISPKRLALAFEKWLAKKDLYILETFNISPSSLQIDTWRRIVNNTNVINEEDAMDETYKVFFDRIRNIPETASKRKYTDYVYYLFNEFCRYYSSSKVLNVRGLFLKMNFYRSAEYGYVPPKNGFSLCRESDPSKKKTDTTQRMSLNSNNNSSLNSTSKKSSNAIILPSTPSSSTSTKTRKTDEEPIVVPSPDLICYICGQHDIPKATWDTFNFEDGYIEHLEATAHQRKVGHTGTGSFWDPRVFIQCAECHLKVHCGCPNPPIKKYPQKFQSFVCIHCDTKEEEVSLKSDYHRRRGTTGINYKV